jgi:hypothetical protein
VNVDQFFGIEIEEFPAQIAQVALWLVDHQMNLRVSEEFGLYFARIPLKAHRKYATPTRCGWTGTRCCLRSGAVTCWAIRRSWVTATKAKNKKPTWLRDAGIHGAGVLDFVCGWYILAARYCQGFKTRRGICLDQQHHPRRTSGSALGRNAAPRMHIHFAHRTFQWSNEARGNAAVHCVIVGFGTNDQAVKTIYEYEDIKGLPLAVPAKSINPYLIDAPTVFLPKRREPICNIPQMSKGSQPTDGGNLLMNDEEKAALLAVDPKASKWIRPFLGGEEFINAIPRWCLWLVDCPPKELRLMPEVMKRVQAVKAMRLASSKSATVQLAASPAIFGELRQPKENFIAIPEVSSERRTFIPIGFLSSDIVPSNKIQTISNGTILQFGVLCSTMHNAWMRYTCGRLESRYSYSATIVYNNYPWPGFAGEPLSDKHRTAIEQAAQCVLDARAQFASSSLADLYDPLTMPPALLKAHQKLDTAVDAAYQPSGGKKSYASDAERVAFLFELYQRITSLLPAAAGHQTRPSKSSKGRSK